MTVLSFILSLSPPLTPPFFFTLHTQVLAYTHIITPLPQWFFLLVIRAAFSQRGHGGLFANTHAKQNYVTIFLLQRCYRGMPFVTILINTQLTDFRRDLFFLFCSTFLLYGFAPELYLLLPLQSSWSMPHSVPEHQISALTHLLPAGSEKYENAPRM